MERPLYRLAPRLFVLLLAIVSTEAGVAGAQPFPRDSADLVPAVFTGTLSGMNLKPNFACQVKLVGKPEDIRAPAFAS